MDNQGFTTDIRAQFLRRMRISREATGMKQSDVVSHLKKYGIEMGPSTFAKIERGERKIDFAEALAIAQVLGIPISDMTPKIIDPAQQLTREASRVFMTAQDAQSTLFEGIMKVESICRGLDKLKSVYAANGDHVADAEDRWMLEELTDSKVRDAALQWSKDLYKVFDQLEELKNLDSLHHLKKSSPDLFTTDPDGSES
ncbi:helix-turn-helix domain-containing protein [Corynebacterium sputi]|uniref:helix-turn-helix domain-containing protein n=1 Tax=Corynebacterium sputi TaxID=489915 RepID=UPI00054D0528|nr:helix-turn-helix transcriptional regulator [Corynebacterium sputi]